MTKPPIARVEVVRDDYFGTVIEDPYRWMEDWEGEESQAFIEGQREYARQFLDALPEREALLNRIMELRDAAPLLTSMQMAGGRTFYLRRDPDDDVSRLVVRVSADAPEKTLFDPNTEEGDAHTAVDWFTPSRDGTLVAYGISQGGSENSVLHLLNVDTGESLPDVITRTQFGAGSISWAEDNGSFVYHRLKELPDDAPPMEQYMHSRSYLHRLGTDPDTDPAIVGTDVNPNLDIAAWDFPLAALPPASDWMLAIILHGVLSELTVYAAPKSALSDPATIPWKKIVDVEDAVTGLKIDGDTIYLTTHKDAPRYKIISTDLRNPDLEGAHTVVPESDVVIQDLLLAGDYILTHDLDAGISRLRRTPKSGGESQAVPLPVEGAIALWAGEPNNPEVLLQLQSFIDAPRLYRYNVESGSMTDTDWIPAAPVDVSSIQLKRVHAPGKDGTPIPLTIIHHRDLKMDGNNPTFLQGYGSYGLNFPVRYSPQMIAWYERGGVHAIAHIRGGGEYGKEWHEAGRLMNKRNTIDDFIAAAEYLIGEGYTRPGLLAGEGTSAGGIPSGGSVVSRPDLWAAMVMRVAVTDSLRIVNTPGGPANVPEFGDVTTEDGFKALHLVDSYSKVRDGVEYPAVMLTTGLNDPRVVAWQATKMAARLQTATASGKPVLLRVEAQGGHGMGASKRQLDEELADILAFLLSQFDREGRESQREKSVSV